MIDSLSHGNSSMMMRFFVRYFLNKFVVVDIFICRVDGGLSRQRHYHFKRIAKHVSIDTH